MAGDVASKPAQLNQETFHLINDPDESIHEALTGLTLQYPQLSYAPKHKIIYRSDLESFRKDHVTSIGFSGGGHEPMFAGFVGHSFLSAYVSGNIFASPTSAQILEAIKMCQGSTPSPSSPGTLIVCGNYTGDILNAGLAITRAQAAGYKVRFVPVGDDVAVGRKKGGKVGRRGLSGHLVGLKIACGLADEGRELDEVTGVMEEIAANVGTIGVAFDRVSLPTSTLAPLPMLPDETIELGMGAHGEPGLQQISPPPSLGELVKKMVELLIDTSDSDRSFIPFSRSNFTSPSEVGSSSAQDNHVILLLNSLGSTSSSVLARVAEVANQELEGKGFVVRRVTVGPFVTSLKMSGVGVTLWRLPVAGKTGGENGRILGREEAVELWDRRVETVSWRQ